MRRLLGGLISAITKPFRFFGECVCVLWSWLRQAGRSRSRRKVAARSAGPRFFRPDLQQLEEICAPSVTAVNDTFIATYGQTVTVGSPGVLSNDFGFFLTASLLTQPSHGTVSLNSNGS